MMSRPLTDVHLRVVPLGADLANHMRVEAALALNGDGCAASRR